MDGFTEDGYCVHGAYVGGCGIDYMCHWCEDGISWEDYCAYWAQRSLDRIRSNAGAAQELMNVLLKYGVPGIRAMEQVDRIMRFK